MHFLPDGGDYASAESAAGFHPASTWNQRRTARLLARSPAPKNRADEPRSRLSGKNSRRKAPHLARLLYQSGTQRRRVYPSRRVLLSTVEAPSYLRTIRE